MEGSRICEECTSSVDFQPEQGQDTCVACPPHSVAANAHSTCICDVGYYAINCTDDNLQLLLEIDPVTYENYYSLYIVADPLPAFNPNEATGIWCAQCPQGADCRRTGTTLDNVFPLEGYFLGVDDVASAFLVCLNSMCAGEGECVEHYTGTPLF